MSSSALLSIGFAVGFSAWALIELGRRLIGKLLDRYGHPCRKGHIWVHSGGRNASCSRDCHCSVPVYLCARCHDFDYGENEEARATIEACPIAQEVRSCICQGGYDQPGDIAYRCNDCPVHGEPE